VCVAVGQDPNGHDDGPPGVVAAVLVLVEGRGAKERWGEACAKLVVAAFALRPELGEAPTPVQATRLRHHDEGLLECKGGQHLAAGGS